jgi:hypothetical protein
MKKVVLYPGAGRGGDRISQVLRSLVGVAGFEPATT